MAVTQTMKESSASSPLVIRTAPAFFANSLVAVGLAVGIARLVEQAGVAIAGGLLGHEPVMTNAFTLLRSPGVEPVALAAPAASLAVGIVLLMLYPGSKDRSAGRLLMLWTLLFCFRNGLAEIARGAFDETSVMGSVFANGSLPRSVHLTISGMAIVGLGLVATGAAPAFLSFSRHRTEIGSWTERLRFMASIALLPGLVGPLLAVPLFIPDQGSGLVASLPLVGVFIILTCVAALFVKSVPPPQVVEERGLAFGLLIGYALAFIVFRFGLAPGLNIPPWDENLRLVWRP